ncbi:MAG: hypothetical protein LBQ38_08340 [Spirochaetaceae bacterium]|jgi:hypothetical protein|nr:hypothetical protein [Spirochaetaceae bacterium]
MNPINHFFRPALVCFLLVLVLSGCPNPADDTSNNEKEEETAITKAQDGTYTLSFTVTGEEVKYFNLGTGEEVTDPAKIKSADWDIAFQGTRLVYTNSGDTALALDSGGFGGVWHVNSTDFDPVTLSDAVNLDFDTLQDVADNPFYTPYNRDIKRWEWNMSGAYERRLNVITFKGYDNENQATAGLTQETAFSLGYLYDKKQFYYNPPLPNGGLRMPPDFRATNQVYIVRHGNGADYSKVQISRFVRHYNELIDAYTVKAKKLDDE